MEILWETIVACLLILAGIIWWVHYAIKHDKFTHLNETIYDVNHPLCKQSNHNQQLIELDSNISQSDQAIHHDSSNSNNNSNNSNKLEQEQEQSGGGGNSRSSNLQLTPWVLSPYLTIEQLSFIRFFIGIYCVIVLIYGSIDTELGNVLPLYAMYSYYTVWNWMLMTLYFLLSSIVPLIAIYSNKIHWLYGQTPQMVDKSEKFSLADDAENTLPGKSAGADAGGGVFSDRDSNNSSGSGGGSFLNVTRRRSNCTNNITAVYIQQIGWILYQIECGEALLVSLTVWCLLFWTVSPDIRRKVMLNFTNLNMHIFNTVFMYFELGINVLPISWHNSLYMVFVACLYLIFSWIYYCLTHYWDYFFLDTSLWYSGIMYVCLLGSHLALYFVALKITQFRDKQHMKKFNFYSLSRKRFFQLVKVLQLLIPGIV